MLFRSVSQSRYSEQALEIADALVRSGSIDLIVIDSVAALVPKAEIEGDMGDSLPGLQARLMSQALRKLTGTIKRTNSMVIFINQIRMKIGVMFGSPETTTGGNALKFYASMRLDIRRIGSIKKGDEVVGNVRVPSDTSGLDNVPWNYYYNLVQQIPVGRRVYYGHFWQDDGMTVFRNRTDYYKLRRDGTTYGDQPSETVTGFGDSNPLKYTSIWGLSAAADGKISFKNFLQKCNTFGVTFDYYWAVS